MAIKSVKITAKYGYIEAITLTREEDSDVVSMEIHHTNNNGTEFARFSAKDMKRALEDLGITAETSAEEDDDSEEECEGYKADISLDVAHIHFEWVEKKHMNLVRFKAYVWRKIKELFRYRVDVTPHDIIEGEITIESSEGDYIDHEDFTAVWKEDNLQVLSCCD